MRSSAGPSRVAIPLIAALVVACSTLQASPDPVATLESGAPDVSGAADVDLPAPFPPAAVKNSLVERLRIGLAPLSDAERGQVTVGRADAIRVALASRAIGNPGPNGVGEIKWTQAGFVYLASYTPWNLPGYGGPRPATPPFPAYLVQVLAPPIPGFPGENTALVVVDARSGEMGTTFGPCVGGLCGPP